MYYVQQVDYEGIAKEHFWLNTLDLKNTSKLVQDFHSQNLDKPDPNL